MALPKFTQYCSNTTGKNALKFTMPEGEVYFSYETPVAFSTNKTGLVVRENDWGVTTGKHLNSIDGGNKKARVPSAKFEKLLGGIFGGN